MNFLCADDGDTEGKKTQQSADNIEKDDKVSPVEEEAARCLGDHPSKNINIQLALVPEISDRMFQYLKEGISSDEKSDILILTPRKHEKFNLIAPEINPEIKALQKDNAKKLKSAIKRDKFSALSRHDCCKFSFILNGTECNFK